MAKKIVTRIFLLTILIPLQSCSNTLIGERLENSFYTSNNQKLLDEKINEKSKPFEINTIKLSQKNENNKNEFIKKDNSISSKIKVSQKPIKSKKKLVFNPQPYRIILRLSGANPSAPAETVTQALRKAGVQFEVEKIERFDTESLLKNTSLKK